MINNTKVRFTFLFPCLNPFLHFYRDGILGELVITHTIPRNPCFLAHAYSAVVTVLVRWSHVETVEYYSSILSKQTVSI